MNVFIPLCDRQQLDPGHAEETSSPHVTLNKPDTENKSVTTITSVCRNFIMTVLMMLFRKASTSSERFPTECNSWQQITSSSIVQFPSRTWKVHLSCSLQHICIQENPALEENISYICRAEVISFYTISPQEQITNILDRDPFKTHSSQNCFYYSVDKIVFIPDSLKSLWGIWKYFCWVFLNVLLGSSMAT